MEDFIDIVLAECDSMCEDTEFIQKQDLDDYVESWFDFEGVE